MKLLGLTLLTSTLLFASLGASANDGEITIRVIGDESALPENVVRELNLPDPAQHRAPGTSERNAAGKASEARKQRRAFGDDSAQDRRENRGTPERAPAGPGAAPHSR